MYTHAYMNIFLHRHVYVYVFTSCVHAYTCTRIL